MGGLYPSQGPISRDRSEKDPVGPKRSKVMLRVDDKTLRWFKSMGPGWQRRVDKVLQAYVLGVVSKVIETLDEREVADR